MGLRESKVCPKCNDVGSIQVNDTLWKQCTCSFLRNFALRVTPEVVGAPVIDFTPLYVPGTATTPTIDKTEKNVFLKGWWGDLLPHFKAAFLFKFYVQPHFRVRFLEDERLKNVWVGNESYKATPVSRREDVETNNSLRDIIGPEIDLVIIRVGTLGYKNKAMPGVLKESLMLRQASNIPTWIVEEPDRLYQEGNVSYSDETFDFISQRFEVVDLTKDRGKPVVQQAAGYLEDDEMLEREYYEPTKRPRKPPPEPESEQPKANLGIAGASDRKKKFGGVTRTSSGKKKKAGPLG
jgi:hypothetical protein